jgi:hypothetical protein
MMSQLSYNNDPVFKRQFLIKVRAHRRADRIVQGSYGALIGKKWKGCAVACSIRSLDQLDKGQTTSPYNDHGLLARRLGIPLVLAHLEDRIFEGLPRPTALEWPARFAEAIPVGADLSGVWPLFALWLLTDEKHGVRQYAKTDRVRDAIDGVAALYRREVAGEKPSIEEWRAARSVAANSYANAAAANAAYAAYAAAYAANSYANAAAAAYAAAAASDAAAAAYAAAAASDAAANRVRLRQKWFKASADKLVELLEA